MNETTGPANQTADIFPDNGKCRITVITVCYNAAPLLPVTMESVLAQDHDDIEYIIQDGMSTDSTPETVESFRSRFEERSIRFIYNRESDGGIYDAMNKGMASAGGSYINFMNAGDCFYDEKAVSAAAAASKNSPVLIYGDCAVYEQGMYFMFPKSPEKIEEAMPFSHQSVFVESGFMRAHPFNTAYTYSADYDLLLTAHESGKSFCDSGAVICITTADGTSSINYRDTMMESIRIRKAHNICRMSDAQIKRTATILKLKQFVLDHFPACIKKMIRRLQISSRGQGFVPVIPPWIRNG